MHELYNIDEHLNCDSLTGYFKQVGVKEYHDDGSFTATFVLLCTKCEQEVDSAIFKMG